ncbi:MAG TPA: hypothetical protein DD451_03850 [Candidatus Moranbacteria bacterium]|nr:hypothetical protein [Candidatus Moranbacteria bacterium]
MGEKIFQTLALKDIKVKNFRTRYAVLADVFFLSSILLVQILFILKENLIFVLDFGQRGQG